MLQQGDKYIHFTKYGGVNKGEVKAIYHTTSYDVKNKVVYKHYSMTNTDNNTYKLGGLDGRFYAIDRELKDEECEALLEWSNKVKTLKR